MSSESPGIDYRYPRMGPEGGLRDRQARKGYGYIGLERPQVGTSLPVAINLLKGVSMQFATLDEEVRRRAAEAVRFLDAIQQAASAKQGVTALAKTLVELDKLNSKLRELTEMLPFTLA
jgi:hypothetical protein